MTFIDLVIGGPDMSGTSTQIRDLISFFQSTGKIVKDISGTELDVLFHCEIFNDYNKNYLNLNEFLNDSNVIENKKTKFILDATKLLQNLRLASMIDNDITTYINPDKADVWIMEEPVRRGAGQTNRVFELNRSKFCAKENQISNSMSHQVYRSDEFYRFRKILREKNKIIIRSRSEESACYQIYDKCLIKTGITKDKYINLPGNKIAFSNPPTHIFLVCNSEKWALQKIKSTNKKNIVEEYKKLITLRTGNRILDDFEKNIEYQLLVNKRYASNWINKLYATGCSKHNSNVPKIFKFNIYDSKENIKENMKNTIISILNKLDKR